MTPEQIKRNDSDLTRKPKQKKAPQPTILLTVGEVASLLGIGERSVWRLSGNGDLPKPISLGRCRRWSRRVIERYIAAKSRAVNQKGQD